MTEENVINESESTAAPCDEALSDVSDDAIASENTFEDTGIEDTVYSLEDEIHELGEQFPEIVKDTESTNPERYSELRAMGLSMKEAYLATSDKKKSADTRGHLRAGAPIMAKSPATGMSRRELEIARSIFEGMSDDQIRKLYNRVKS